jgi:hypothetical protein
MSVRVEKTAKCHKCAQRAAVCECCGKGWCDYCAQFHPKSK